MKNSLALFLGLNLAILVLDFFVGGISANLQLVLAALLIGLVGIPHGAIDNLLFLNNNKTISPIRFYSFYLALIVLVIVVWILSPLISFITFMILSAYHFGQSQFARYSRINRFSKAVLYGTWGLAILSGICVFNQTEILRIISFEADLLAIRTFFTGNMFQVLLICCSVVFLAALLYYQKHIGFRNVAYEITVFLLIQASLFVNPLLLGFSIYFASLHSWEVLQQEFIFLKKHISPLKWFNFIFLLTPYTLVSLVGFGIFYTLSSFNVIAISETLLVFIAISALTLPHSLVMENFYTSMVSKRA